jgi:hypothetical protein
VGRLSRREDLRSGNVSADVMRVMRRRRWEAWWREWWARQLKVRGVDVSDPVRRMAWPVVFFAAIVVLFPVGDAVRQFAGVFTPATDAYEWPESMTLETAPEDYALRRRVRRVVHLVVMEIGHDVAVNSVEVMDVGGLAYYRPKENTIVFSRRVKWTEDGLLRTASHEATHALWAKLLSKRTVVSGFDNLINEMTAYVLGAHLAGQVRTREGGDGEALRKKAIERYRAMCDDTNPWSSRNSVTERWVFMRGNMMSPAYYEHWGSVQMVDEMDAICSRYHYSAWDAAKAIVERYLTEPSTTKANPTPSASSQVEW